MNENLTACERKALREIECQLESLTQLIFGMPTEKLNKIIMAADKLSTSNWWVLYQAKSLILDIARNAQRYRISKEARDEN